MSSSTTGGPCSRKSALPAQKAATTSGVERSRTKVTRAASLRRRRERDLKAFRRQVAAVNRHELRRVEERAERLDDPEAHGRHGGRSIRRRATEPGGLVEPRA